MPRWPRRLVAVCFGLILFQVFAQVFPETAFGQSDVDLTLFPGASADVALNVPTAGAPSKLDVVFVIDNTGSMSTPINALKAGATQFMTDLQAASDAQFAIVTFNDPAVALVHDLSADVTSVQTALQGIVAAGGGDCPDVSLDGLTLAATGVSWRADARRIAFAVTDTGAKSGSLLTISLSSTIADLTAADVTVNALVFTSACNYTEQSLQTIADSTGGIAQYGILSSNAGLTTTYMADMLALNTATITVIPTPQSCDPLSITTTPPQSTVSLGDPASFTETILAPPTPFGSVACTVEMQDDNGLVLSTQSITVTQAAPVPVAGPIGRAALVALVLAIGGSVARWRTARQSRGSIGAA